MNNLHGCVAALILLIVANDNDVKRMKTNYQMLILMSKLRRLNQAFKWLVALNFLLHSTLEIVHEQLTKQSGKAHYSHSFLYCYRGDHIICRAHDWKQINAKRSSKRLHKVGTLWTTKPNKWKRIPMYMSSSSEPNP